ncbi:MAG: ribonuclease HII [Nanopusillaceae archaeon]
MKILGIDEAGRGPVIGPLVIVGVQYIEEKIEDLIELGVKDSKELSREEREKIFEEIIKIVDFKYKIISPSIIDHYVEKKGLNQLEFLNYCKIIEEFKSPKVFIDSFIKNSQKLKEKFEKTLSYKPELIVEVKADKKYPIVSAASIIAKVIRDMEIDKIKKETGIDFGSGYPSDERTIKALKENYEILKDYVRKTWFTVKKIKSEKQKKIFDFFKL